MVESPIQSSFIPKDAASVASPVRKSAAGLHEFMILIAIVLFVASSVLAVGVFLYKQFLQTQDASKKAEITRAKAAFEPTLIQQLTRLDDRMQTADQLLQAHVAPTIFFDVLSQVTLTTVSFQSLALDANDSQHIKMSMSGIAESVNSIALQADLFSKSSMITSPIFSGVARQIDGVHFSVTANVNPAALSYASLVQGSAPQGAAQPSASSSPFTRPGVGAPPQNGAQSTQPATPPQGQ